MRNFPVGSSFLGGRSAKTNSPAEIVPMISNDSLIHSFWATKLPRSGTFDEAF